MIRTLITPTNTDVHLVIPESYVGKTIEITYLAIEELEKVKEKPVTMSQFKGILTVEEAQELNNYVAKSRNEW